MDQRIFRFDAQINQATGLNPEEVSKQYQIVQIFNPEVRKYLKVQSSFANKPENKSNLVRVAQDHRDGNKRFLLENIGDNEYRIKSVDSDTEEETGFLYVSDHTSSGFIQSSSNVLRSETIAFKEELYVFEFIRNSEQNGVYKIRCKANGKVLFASDDRSCQVKADREDREKSNKIWFQISMPPHRDVKKITVEQNSNSIFSDSEDSPILIDEVFNEWKYNVKQWLPEEFDQLSCYIEKLKVNEKAILKANKDLNISKSNLPVRFIGPARVAYTSYIPPRTIKPGKKIVSRGSSGSEFIEKKIQIEFEGKKFNGYSLCIVDWSAC